MKILWSSNAPWAPSGYGQQTALFAPRIQQLGYDIAINSVWGLDGAGLEWNGLRIYPTDQKWGNEMLVEYAAHHAAGDPGRCLTITLHDVFVLIPERMRQLDLACWCPVDHDPCPAKVINVFRATGARPIAMSRFGEDRLRAHGLDPLYVPHGVNLKAFEHIDPAAAREARGLPNDEFIVGMVAANQGQNPPRKAWPQIFQAFAKFHRKHKDTRLYLHTDILGRNIGLNLIELAEACGIPPDRVGASDQVIHKLGFYGDTDMADIYSCFDVLANPSYGEGFGIPIIEAQAAGVPVIVTDFSAMPELCGAGWKVGGTPWWDPSQGSWFLEPDVVQITDALEEAYQHANSMGDQAREFAAGYDADHILDTYWKPVLEQLGRPREIPALPNRAYRRAAKKEKAAVA